MKKKNFLIAAIAAISSFALFIPFVSANEQVYYTNENGATLNKEQYDRLVEEFGIDLVATMSISQINAMKELKDFNTQRATKYIRTEEYYDNAGTLLQSYSYEITKDEYNNGSVIYQPYSATVKRTYNDRVLVMEGRGSNPRVVTITNTWTKIPSVKSFDVIALRPEGINGITGIFTSDNDGYSGFQKYDGTRINYAVGNGNYKIDSSMNGNGGIGLSQNLVNSTKTSLVNSMTVSFANSSNRFFIYGTYQHATSNVTLAQSKNYSIHYSGYGNVLLFNSGVRGYYDGVVGLELSFDGTEL